MTALAPRLAEHFVKAELQQAQSRVDAERQLREVVGPHREAVEDAAAGVDLDHVVWDLAHYVDLQAARAAP